MVSRILAVAFLFMVCPFDGMAQSKDVLVGTWKLVSATDTTEKGEVRDAYGQNPSGLLTYTADGRMMAIITHGGRRPTDLVRFIVRLQGNRVTLRTPPFLKGGMQMAHQELIWERMESEKTGR